MLTTLLGSKSAERVLLYLLVNECCYASELQKNYGIGLTPLQHILGKLEKAEVVEAEQRGKTKLYRFNPQYPLLVELKLLLKKAFTLLSPEEKRTLFGRYERETAPHRFAKQKTLQIETLWDRLSLVRRVLIQNSSGMEGLGDVSIKTGHEALLFTEKGQWISPQVHDFKNVLKWTLDRSSQLISLEHLRHGPNRPVFLFHLAPLGPLIFQSVDSHLCKDDCYFGRIEMSEHHLRFMWRILGPSKNETLFHTYEI